MGGAQNRGASDCRLRLWNRRAVVFRCLETAHERCSKLSHPGNPAHSIVVVLAGRFKVGPSSVAIRRGLPSNSPRLTLMMILAHIGGICIRRPTRSSDAKWFFGRKPDAKRIRRFLNAFDGLGRNRTVRTQIAYSWGPLSDLF